MRVAGICSLNFKRNICTKVLTLRNCCAILEPWTDGRGPEARAKKVIKMTKVTLTEIKKAVESKGGNYKKCGFKLNGNDAYEVNGKTYTKPQLIEAYKLGDI